MLGIIWTLVSFIIAISVLVAFHEFGHFWVARRLGIKVLRFSIGFGKPLWRRQGRDGVEYVIASIPLGGYVKMLDEREGPVAEAELSQAFNRQSVPKRIAVFFAGPAFNFLLAVVFYWALYIAGIPGLKPVIAEPAAGTIAAIAGLHVGDRVSKLGTEPVPTWADLRTGLLEAGLGHAQLAMTVVGRDGVSRSLTLDLSNIPPDPEKLFATLGLQPYVPPIPPVLGTVLPDKAAAQAGFMVGDRILALDGLPMASFQEIQAYVIARPGHVLKAEVQRGEQRIELSAIIGSETQSGVSVGRLGVMPQEIAANDDLWQDLRAEQRLAPWAAVPAALNQTWQISGLTLKLLYHMVRGEVSVKNVSGPIQIAQAAGASASAGLGAFVGFIAVISISIGIFNLLPIPILDGGQILFGLIEAAKGSPLSERFQIAGQQIGLTLLMLLMGLAFYNDIVRQLS
jgi:regulator of sigma E protease